MTDELEERPVHLTPRTLIPVAAALGVCGTVVGAALWMNTKFNSIDVSLLLANKKIDTVAEDVIDLREQAQSIQQKLDSQYWSLREMRQWAKLFQAQNPTLNVPATD